MDSGGKKTEVGPGSWRWVHDAKKKSVEKRREVDQLIPHVHAGWDLLLLEAIRAHRVWLWDNNFGELISEMASLSARGLSMFGRLSSHKSAKGDFSTSSSGALERFSQRAGCNPLYRTADSTKMLYIQNSELSNCISSSIGTSSPLFTPHGEGRQSTSSQSKGTNRNNSW